MASNHCTFPVRALAGLESPRAVSAQRPAVRRARARRRSARSLSPERRVGPSFAGKRPAAPPRLPRHSGWRAGPQLAAKLRRRIRRVACGARVADRISLFGLGRISCDAAAEGKVRIITPSAPPLVARREPNTLFASDREGWRGSATSPHASGQRLKFALLFARACGGVATCEMALSAARKLSAGLG